ncbi:hypothetical protein X749_03175 [Mesorhizobium sp. LNJC391B00]|nr:hypothetical protein X749_03175 [Mesorhizobium sp. LNJC391B00]
MMGGGHRLAQGEHQPVCGGVQDETDWLAIGERQLVRSESWLLCILIWFSAWPRAQ